MTDQRKAKTNINGDPLFGAVTILQVRKAINGGFDNESGEPDLVLGTYHHTNDTTITLDVSRPDAPLELLIIPWSNILAAKVAPKPNSTKSLNDLLNESRGIDPESRRFTDDDVQE